MDLSNFNHEYLDAPENAFLRRELEHVRTKLYETLFPQFMARTLVSVNHEVPSGAEVDTFNIMKEYGEAQLGGGYSNTPPRVDVSISDVSASIKPIKAAYGYSMQEVRAAILAGRPIDPLKAKVARTIVEQKIDQTIMFGSSANGLAGLFALSGTNTQAVLTGAAGDTWLLKTSDEIVKDIFALINKSHNVSKGIYTVDTVAMSTIDSQFLEERRMRDSNNTSILDHVRGLRPGIDFKANINLEAAPASEWTGTRIMAYSNSEEFLESVIPQEFEQLAPQVKDYETVVNCHARIAGIRLPHPKSVTYMDNVQSQSA